MKNDSPNNVPESTIHVLCRKGRSYVSLWKTSSLKGISVIIYFKPQMSRSYMDHNMNQTMKVDGGDHSW